MGCTVQIVRGVIDGERSARNGFATDFGIGREHAMEANEIEPGARHEGGQQISQWDRRTTESSSRAEYATVFGHCDVASAKFRVGVVAFGA